MRMVTEREISPKKLQKFLGEVDDSFPIQLSEKVDIAEYSYKLISLGTIKALVSPDDEIVSLTAGYTNFPSEKYAYISIVSTGKSYRNKGYATKTIMEFIKEAEIKGFLGVHLYTDPENNAAIYLYEHLGFCREHFCLEDRPNDVHLLRISNKNVLITAVGSMSASSSIEHLQNNGYNVIGTDIYPKEWIANSNSVTTFYQIPRTTDNAAYINSIRNIIKNEKIGYVIPSTDLEVDLLSQCRDMLDAVLCASHNSSIKLARDKNESYIALKQVIPDVVIPTKILSGDESSFPAVCKPRNGRSSEGLHYINDEEELNYISKRVSKHQYVIQPRISGKTITVDILRQPEAGMFIMMPRIEHIRTSNGAGLSVSIFNPSSAFEKVCETIADSLDIVGCANLEFIQDKSGGIHFLECNPRFSGGIAFSCMSGYDFIINHLRCFQGLRAQHVEEIVPNTIARRYVEEITLSK